MSARDRADPGYTGRSPPRTATKTLLHPTPDVLAAAVRLTARTLLRWPLAAASKSDPGPICCGAVTAPAHSRAHPNVVQTDPRTWPWWLPGCRGAGPGQALQPPLAAGEIEPGCHWWTRLIPACRTAMVRGGWAPGHGPNSAGADAGRRLGITPPTAPQWLPPNRDRQQTRVRPELALKRGVWGLGPGDVANHHYGCTRSIALPPGSPSPGAGLQRPRPGQPGVSRADASHAGHVAIGHCRYPPPSRRGSNAQPVFRNTAAGTGAARWATTETGQCRCALARACDAGLTPPAPSPGRRRTHSSAKLAHGAADSTE